jgi:uncharacterized damage-inducible protein DinB
MSNSPYTLMALNNADANTRLLTACEALSAEEFAAPRTSFFPSLRATLNHILWVDFYYIDALTGGGRGYALFDDRPDYATAAELRPAQAESDARLIAFCQSLKPSRERDILFTDRGPMGKFRERTDLILLHLFQHQIHHRGQAHAMLSGTHVKPPQLDEFFCALDANPANPELPL